ncbi:EamA family transporter [Gordonia iterans]|uniref:EamA family transporter n=1 Tax=Gordonia iterans TaxID=1004901 RepID=UPI001F3B906D|nr:hypothetical protein [Gordonia iterans]
MGPVLGLALVFSVMNVCLYASVERIGLGLAVTLEFLGPLAVAIGGSRRAVDVGCAVLAGVGVVMLADPGPTTDVIGIALGLVAATAWASYILLNRSAGARLPGLHGTALAAGVSTVVWLPSRWSGSPPTRRHSRHCCSPRHAACWRRPSRTRSTCSPCGASPHPCSAPSRA